MSAGVICDQCGVVLEVSARGDDEMGEYACWLKIETTYGKYDLCSRACVVAFMEDEDFVAVMDAQAEVVAAIARSLRGEDDAREAE